MTPEPMPEAPEAVETLIWTTAGCTLAIAASRACSSVVTTLVVVLLLLLPVCRVADETPFALPNCQPAANISPPKSTARIRVMTTARRAEPLLGGAAGVTGPPGP